MYLPLRCNVVIRDWHKGINKYRAHGLDPEEVCMNAHTCHMLVDFIVKQYGTWISSVETRCEYHNAYDNKGTLIARYARARDIYVEGIKIIIDNSMKNETMRVVW